MSLMGIRSFFGYRDENKETAPDLGKKDKNDSRSESKKDAYSSIGNEWVLMPMPPSYPIITKDRDRDIPFHTIIENYSGKEKD